MGNLCLAFLLVYLSSTFTHVKSLTPLSDEYIQHINEQNLTWKAKRHFVEGTTLSQVKRLLGLKHGLSRYSLKTITYDDVADIPESFDAREKWSNCSSLKQIRDQANCGSCWAFATTEAMTDRICIHSNGTVTTSVSAEDLLSCCTDCGDGCDGGEPIDAWNYWHKTGIVSGGLYGSHDGCRAYSLAPCDHHVEGTLANCSAIVEADTPKCVKACDNGTDLTYKSELTFGLEPYQLENVTSIQWEIMTNGPVEAEFDVYDDFLVYSEGIYQKVEDAVEVGGHDVKIIGWGIEEDVPYWLIANSWNTDWGEKGYFRIIRGENHCGIEGGVKAALPKLDNGAITLKIQIITVFLSTILYIIQHRM